jgi:CNT family concentrative nucleoside transporter
MKKILLFFLLCVSFISFIPAQEQDTSAFESTSEQQIVQNKNQITQVLTQGSKDVTTKERFGLVLRGLLGILVLILIAYVFSIDRKSVSFKAVGIGLSIQIFIAVSVLYIPFIGTFIDFIGKLFVLVLNSSGKGAEFLFGSFMDQNKTGFIFAFQVLPTIIFFSALMSLLFYLGIVQRIVYAMAWLLKKALHMSGPESLAVAGNVFLGQTESPLLIKAYLPKLTGSELFVVMVSGMATIAGAVLATYIGLLSSGDEVAKAIFAKHFITASVMAAPGAIVVAKIIFPQTENIDKDIKVPREQMGANVLDAVSVGSYEGLKLAANVAIMLLVFYAFIALFNKLLGGIGNISFKDSDSLNTLISTKSGDMYPKLSIEFLLGKIFSPLMWIIGVPKEDLSVLGRLMGEKIIFTEFVSYGNLKNLMELGAIKSPKSIIMATYMLCGFANIASVGIQVGGIGSLAPQKRVFLSKFGMKALLGGTIASLLSATIIGVIA